SFPVAVSIQEKKSGIRFDSLPSGKGTVTCFSDINGNSTHDRGRIFPWQAPEPIYTFADTIEARSRWDIEGVALRRNSCFCADSLFGTTH
ncbi:MAG: hypothetical protein JW795_11045, partial [Chitinivibrionales bacterium]|nr:hypothetical protein [Chitinivibrionales bacterium]